MKSRQQKVSSETTPEVDDVGKESFADVLGKQGMALAMQELYGMPISERSPRPTRSHRRSRERNQYSR